MYNIYGTLCNIQTDIDQAVTENLPSNQENSYKLGMTSFNFYTPAERVVSTHTKYEISCLCSLY